jgi:Flp pilus assembly CpaE family ATPase
MEDVARVVLAVEAAEVAEEVLHFLDRSGRARVVSTAGDDRQLAEAVRQLEPDAVVAEPGLALGGVDGVTLLALATRESVGALRAAIRAGARGFYLWPREREGLLDGVVATMSARAALERTALVVTVHASRGGAGCTFVATHLAQAFARRDASCVLIDADPVFGDVATALGATGDEPRTIADLVPLGDELSAAQLDSVLMRHPSGFGALLAPAMEVVDTVDHAVVRRTIEIAASSADVVVVHLPRALDATSRWCLANADRALEVLSLDVLSFRAATRGLEALAPLGLGDRIGFVVNRAARSEITPRDVRRAFGSDPLAVLPFDAGVPRAQDHGRLVGSRGRLGRAFDRLAAALLNERVEEAVAT